MVQQAFQKSLGKWAFHLVSYLCAWDAFIILSPLCVFVLCSRRKPRWIFLSSGSHRRGRGEQCFAPGRPAGVLIPPGIITYPGKPTQVIRCLLTCRLKPPSGVAFSWWSGATWWTPGETLSKYSNSQVLSLNSMGEKKVEPDMIRSYEDRLRVGSEGQGQGDSTFCFCCCEDVQQIHQNQHRWDYGKPVSTLLTLAVASCQEGRHTCGSQGMSLRDESSAGVHHKLPPVGVIPSVYQLPRLTWRWWKKERKNSAKIQ